MQSASEITFHVHLHHLLDIRLLRLVLILSWGGGGQGDKTLLSGRRKPGEVVQCVDADAPMLVSRKTSSMSSLTKNRNTCSRSPRRSVASTWH